MKALAGSKNPNSKTLSYGVTVTVILTVNDGPCYTHPLKGFDG